MSLRDRRHLPSIGAFATFEVVAKHLSFTRTANELNVTQAAVSQQIRLLERSLGAALFLRGHNSLELTEAGKTLLRAVSSGLDEIGTAVLSLGDRQPAATITLSATVALSQYWLSPLIAAFRRDNPETSFTILASDEDDALRNFEAVDLALICGNERCEVGDDLLFLFSECVKPVCSVGYLADRGPFATPEALLAADILDLHEKHWSSDAICWQPLTWSNWFTANASDGAMPEEPLRPAMVSNSYPILVEAAVEGRGVVLGWQHLVKSHLESGKLSIAYDGVLQVDRGTFLKINQTARDKLHVSRFVDFMVARTKNDTPWS